MNKFFWIVLVSGLLSGAFTACNRKNQTTQPSAEKKLYQCPMHPQITADKPGDCPICHMQLVPVETAPATQNSKPLFYRHPMNPSVTSPVPAKDEMGMDYVPVYKEEMSSSGGIPGHAPFKVSPDLAQRIGLRTAIVSRQKLDVPIHASGRVAYDPELYSALIEYREAVKTAESARASEWADVREQSESLMSASRRRLSQMGISPEQAAGLSRQADSLLAGHPGRARWIYADIYAHEVGLVKKGQSIEATAAAQPGETWRGTIRSVDSVINSETRTLRVRAMVQDPKGRLTPEMYVDVTIFSTLGTRLAIPCEAVVNTGERQLAYVLAEEGMYEPREIKAGHEAGDRCEVMDGLKEGETVVSSANFLIDSESRLKSAIEKAGNR